MTPTLKAIDQVYVTGDHKFGPGDIVLFEDPATGKKIVHRVLAVEGGKVVTRGDNNPLPDTYNVRPEDVLGRVAYIYRNGRKIYVRGGMTGLASVVPHRLSMQLLKIIEKLAVMPYQALARSGICRIWLPQRMKPHTLSFMGPEGPELRVMMGKRLAGVWRPGFAGWRINPPYKLFLDERSLPQVPSCGGACGTNGARDDERGDRPQ